jgi:hypothetical protein
MSSQLVLNFLDELHQYESVFVIVRHIALSLLFVLQWPLLRVYAIRIHQGAATQQPMMRLKHVL